MNWFRKWFRRERINGPLDGLGQELWADLDGYVKGGTLNWQYSMSEYVGLIKIYEGGVDQNRAQPIWKLEWDDNQSRYKITYIKGFNESDWVKSYLSKYWSKKIRQAAKGAMKKRKEYEDKLAQSKIAGARMDIMKKGLPI